MFLKAFERQEVRDFHDPAIHQKGGETMIPSPAGHIGMVSFAATDKRSKELHRGIHAHGLQLSRHRGKGTFLNCDMAFRTVLGAEFGKKEPEELMDLGDGGNRGFSTTSGDALLDGDTGRKALNPIDIGFFKLIDKLPGVRGHAVEKAALSLGKKNVESQGRFTTAAQARDHDQLVTGNIQGDILEIMLARTPDLDGTGGRRGGLPQGCLHVERRSSCKNLAEIATGMGAFMRGHFLGGSGDDELSSPVTGFGSDVDHPVGGLDDIKIMFDDDDAVALGNEPLERFQQDGDIVHMKSGGRLVKDEKRPSGFVSRQTRRKFEPLGLPAAQDIQRLTEFQIIETNIGEKLKGTANGCGFRPLLEEGDGLPCRHFQNVVDRFAAMTDGQDPFLIASAFALRTTQEEIAQELHLHLLITEARAAVATSLAGVEGKSRGTHPRGDGLILHPEEFPHGIKYPEIHNGGRAWSAGDRRLVDHHDIGQILPPFDRAATTGGITLFSRRRGEIPVENIAYK